MSSHRQPLCFSRSVKEASCLLLRTPPTLTNLSSGSCLASRAKCNLSAHGRAPGEGGGGGGRGWVTDNSSVSAQVKATVSPFHSHSQQCSEAGFFFFDLNCTRWISPDLFFLSATHVSCSDIVSVPMCQVVNSTGLEVDGTGLRI